MMKIYQYSKCSTCRKAIRFLEEKGIDFQSVDITQTPPPKAAIKKMLKLYDGQIRKLFNTSGLVYREMRLGEKLDEMSESDAIELLASNGKLVKRPFALSQDRGVVGFKEKDWEKFL